MKTKKIEVRNLSITYPVYDAEIDRLKEFVLRKKLHRDFKALNNISFDVFSGEVMGIIGQNGAGKSTLLKAICNKIIPNQGYIKTNGRISAILELGTGFNPEYTGLENIKLGALCIGLSPKEVNEKIDEIIDFSELKDVINMPFKTYSSGMQGRLTFSTAISVSPDILIVDEALAAGDAYFASKALSRIKEICDSGATVLFVSHGSNIVSRLCDKALYLERGNIKKIGDAGSVVSNYEDDVLKKTNLYFLNKNKDIAFVREKNNKSSLQENIVTKEKNVDLEQLSKFQKNELEKNNKSSSENTNLSIIKPISNNEKKFLYREKLAENYEVFIRNIKLYANNLNNESYCLYTGEKFYIKFDVVSNVVIHNPAVWIRINKDDGTLITSWLSHEPGFIPFLIKNTTQSIILSTQNLLLGDGKYKLSIAIFPDDFFTENTFYLNSIQHEYDIIQFEVKRKYRTLNTIFDQNFELSISYNE